MQTVTIGGHTYTDDNSPVTGLNSGGHKTRLLPLVADITGLVDDTASIVPIVQGITDSIQLLSTSAAGCAVDTSADLVAIQEAIAAIDISGAEPALGNPATSGMFLTSTPSGTRSWATAGILGALIGSMTLDIPSSNMNLTGLNLPLDSTKKYLMRYKIVPTANIIQWMELYLNTSRAGRTFGLSGLGNTTVYYNGTGAYLGYTRLGLDTPITSDTLIEWDGINWVCRTTIIGEWQVCFSDLITFSSIKVAITSLGIYYLQNYLGVGSTLSLYEYNGVMV